MALDRSVISERVWNGMASPLSSIATPTTWGYAREVFAKALAEADDTARARLVTEAQHVIAISPR